MSMLDEKKKNFLKDKGWKELNGLWQNPNGNEFPNGYSLKTALLIQAENDIIDKQGICYRAIPNFLGFGYDIRGRESKKSCRFDKWTKINFPIIADAHICSKKLNDGAELQKHSYNFNYNKILILQEGADIDDNLNKYYFVPNFIVFGKIALKIILERDFIGQGHWYDFDYPRKPFLPYLSKNESSKLLLQKDREIALKLWSDYESNLKIWYNNAKMKKLFEKIKKEKNPIDAAIFLDKRKNESFEGFKLVNSERIYQ